jgi:hypothetical protein
MMLFLVKGVMPPPPSPRSKPWGVQHFHCPLRACRRSQGKGGTYIIHAFKRSAIDLSSYRSMRGVSGKGPCAQHPNSLRSDPLDHAVAVRPGGGSGWDRGTVRGFEAFLPPPRDCWSGGEPMTDISTRAVSACPPELWGEARIGAQTLPSQASLILARLAGELIERCEGRYTRVSGGGEGAKISNQSRGWIHPVR